MGTPLGSDDADVYAAHAARLRALSAVLAGPSSADDVVSAAFLRAISSPGWPTVVNRGAYLTRVVVNEVRSRHRSDLRREARERAISTDEAAHDVHAVPEVLAALATLPLRQRTVVFLTYWADLTPADIASDLQISEGAVRKHLARGRESLRRRLR